MKSVLILSVGIRNALVQYFKETIGNKGKVIATDNSFLAPGLYDADTYYVMPRIDAPDYWDKVEDICKAENVGLIVSLIDPELELLSKEAERFKKLGILVNTSDEAVIKSTYRKSSLLNYLKEHGYNTIKTYTSCEETLAALEAGEISFPLFIKPDMGSGSLGILRVENEKELEILFKPGYIAQEYMNGEEIGVDVFVDLISGEVSSIFAKKKIRMRAGETDKSVSYKNEKLFDLISKFALEFGLKGVNDLDVFEKDGEFYISEVNPRFGGGYLHAYKCGVNFPKMLINNMNGIVNDVNIGDYSEKIYMMKYIDVKMLDEND